MGLPGCAQLLFLEVEAEQVDSELRTLKAQLHHLNTLQVLKDKLWPITLLKSLFEQIEIHELSSSRQEVVWGSGVGSCYRANVKAEQKSYVIG